MNSKTSNRERGSDGQSKYTGRWTVPISLSSSLKSSSKVLPALLPLFGEALVLTKSESCTEFKSDSSVQSSKLLFRLSIWKHLRKQKQVTHIWHQYTTTGQLGPVRVGLEILGPPDPGGGPLSEALKGKELNVGKDIMRKI